MRKGSISCGRIALPAYLLAKKLLSQLLNIDPGSRLVGYYFSTTMMNTIQKTTFWTVMGVGGLLAYRWLARKQRTIELAGRTVLITGGSRGLGLELARQLIDAGANVAICARSRKELQEARSILKQRAKASGQSVEILTLPCDVTDRAQVQKTVKQVMKSWGAIDILINNAGVIQVGPLEEMQAREYEEAINTHYWGPFYTTEAVLTMMRERRQGRIVNIASIGGKVSIPHLHPYSASKHALVGLSEGYRAELLKDHVYVTTVCPGLIRTGSPKNATFKGKNHDEYTWFALSDSLPMLSLSVSEVAQAILEATRKGSGTVVLSLPAKLLATLNGLFPALMSDVFGLINRWLPSHGGIGTDRALGSESQSRWAPSLLTSANKKAAARNNQ